MNLELELFPIWLAGMHDGARHDGGLRVYGEDATVMRIESDGRVRLETLAGEWSEQRYSIAAARNRCQIELEHARADSKTAESVFQSHCKEYKRAHRGMDPLSGKAGTRKLGFWLIAACCVIGEIPFTSAAFERMLPTDWERIVATLGASVVTIFLSHAIGDWFARPAKTLGQRVFGWGMVATLVLVLSALSLARTETVRRHLQQPAKSAPEVRLQMHESDWRGNA